MLVLLVEHVVPMGLEQLVGCSRDNAVLGGWPSFQMPRAVELSSSPVPVQSQSNNFERHTGQGLG